MPEPDIRKISTCVERILHEGGPRPSRALRRAQPGVIRNPFQVGTSGIALVHGPS